MGRKTGALVAAAALVLLSACGPEENAAPTRYTYTPQVDVAPAQPARDARMCQQFEALKSANGRLASDGYADSYSNEWDELMRAAGC